MNALPTDDPHMLLASVPGSVYPLAGERCLFRPDGAASCHVITGQVLRALDVCARFRSLDAHAAAVTSAIAELAGRETQVRQVLGDLAERGLLRSAESLLAAYRAADGDGAGGAMDVAIRTTGGKPLKALLDSLEANERRHGNRYRYWVFDDARTEERQESAAELVEAARDRGLACRFLTREWQDEFTGRLADAAGAPEARWLFAPPKDASFSGGRVWNVALAALAGRRFVLLDDDLVCEPRSLPGLDGALRIGEGDWSLWFHGGREEARRFGEACELDPLARHGRYLGGPLGGVVSELADDEALARLDSRDLAGIAPRGPVLATAHGTYGDAASATNLWFFTATGESRERFWASREGYDRCLRSRWVTRLRPGHTLLSRPTFTPAGLDGTRLLPPTLPVGRDEDFLFGVLLERAHPGGRVLNFPWALGHFPGDVRRWEQEAHEAPITPNAGRFMADNLLAGRDASPGASPESRLALAADQLAGIAGESDHDLQGRVDEYLLYARSDLVRQLQDRMAEAPEAPVYWAADVRRIVETNGRALSATQVPRLTGMPEDDAAGLAWLRGGLSSYAAALAAWPALWREAVERGGPDDEV